MKTERPQIRSVHIKIQEYEGSKYKGCKTIRVYDTTAAKMEKFLNAAIKNNGEVSK